MKMAKHKIKRPLMKDYEIGKYTMSTSRGIITDYVARNRKSRHLVRGTTSRTRDAARKKLKKIIYPKK